MDSEAESGETKQKISVRICSELPHNEKGAEQNMQDRKTIPSATLKNQWKSIAKRAMLREVFLTLEHYLAEKGAADDVSRTKGRCTLTGHQGLKDIFKELSTESPGQASVDEDIILKKFRGGGYSRLEISAEKPIEFYYSYTTETIRVTCHYAFWNVHNIPQHIR